MTMKRLFTRLLCAALTAVLLTACSHVRQDRSPVTILLGGGMDQEYLKMLADGVREEYGIEVKYVNIITSVDGSNRLLLEMMHGKMPTDMVLYTMRVDTTYANHQCLDLMSYSSIVSSFNFNTIQRCSSPDGAVYQLPLSSRLIGIAYNATLMEEMGWEVPRNYADMLALKEKCRRAGITFATTNLHYTGHGFNYFFHLMGAQWLTTLEGSEWYSDYQNGQATIDRLEEESAYFDRWLKDGFFGEIGGSGRPLFHFDLSNWGGNNTDQYKIMPWLSEDGSANGFTLYDNIWVMVSNSLLEPGKEEKLKQVGTILNYLVRPELVDHLCSKGNDVYVDVAHYVPDSTKLYYDYVDEIRNGFTQPWYYDDFTNNVIVSTGEKINSYMLRTTYHDPVPPRVYQSMYFTFDPTADFHSIFTTMDRAHRGVRDTLFVATEEMDCRCTALINAIAGAQELQRELTRECPDAPEVEVAMMPYATTFGGTQPFHKVAIQDMALHEGPFYATYINTLIPAMATSMYGFLMTGAEIQSLADRQFDPSSYFMNRDTGTSTYDLAHYGPYPYALVTKHGQALDPQKQYVVAIPPRALTREEIDRLVQDNKVLRSPTDDHVITAQQLPALTTYFQSHHTLNPTTLVW